MDRRHRSIDLFHMRCPERHLQEPPALSPLCQGVLYMRLSLQYRLILRTDRTLAYLFFNIFQDIGVVI
jgi:hypothetical protein